MGELRVVKEGPVGAPPDVVWTLITDFNEHHPKFLPPAFSDFKVEEGGVGAGTVFSFTLKAGGRTRPGRMRVEEPEPGRGMPESALDTSVVTRWTVTPAGTDSRLRLETTWQGAGGIGGFFER